MVRGVAGPGELFGHGGVALWDGSEAMKPIVVIDSDAFIYPDTDPEVGKELAKRKSEQLREEGYLLLPVKPGARVEVLGMPPDVGKGVEGRVPVLPMANRIPLVLLDADCGIGEQGLEELRQVGYLPYLVRPGSRIQVL